MTQTAPNRPTQMQRKVMAARVSGQRPAQIAGELGLSISAVYQRDYRGRKKLALQQRQRYAKAIKTTRGRRVKLRPISLSFVPNT